MAKETNRLNIHVYGCEFEVHAPKEKEQIYLMAAEYVDKKIDAYMDAFVRIPLPQKSTQEILLMVMFDIAVGSIETRQSLEMYKHLTQAQRYYIYVERQKSSMQKFIAEAIGVSV